MQSVKPTEPKYRKRGRGGAPISTVLIATSGSDPLYIPAHFKVVARRVSEEA